MPVLGFPHALAETEATSQYLDMTLDVTKLELVMHSTPLKTGSRHRGLRYFNMREDTFVRTEIPLSLDDRRTLIPCFALAFDIQTRVLYECFWDTDLPSKAPDVAFKGILIKQDISNPTREQEDCVLVIEGHGDHYERVGIFWFLPHTAHVFEADGDAGGYR